MRITASNCQSFGSGTLIRAFSEMSQFQSEDVEQQIEILGVQTACWQVLEARGFTYDEDDGDWVYVIGAQS